MVTYRPTRGDILAGIRVRDRVRRLNVLRWALIALIAGLEVLPERGLRDPADVDRLRAILDRNLRRL